MIHEPPAELLMYASLESCAKIVGGQSLKASPPNALNDPFECWPGGYEEIDDRDLDRAIADPASLSRIRQGMIAADHPPAEVDRCIKRLAHGIGSQTTRARLRSDVQGHDLRSIRDEVSGPFGVICFSEVCDSLLMWSHYADRHKGVCIGFRPSEVGGAGGPTWLKVAYSHSRPKALFGARERPELLLANAVRIVSTKACSWCYEQEWRLLVRLCQCTEEHGMRLKPFPLSAITRVIFGCACPQEMRDSALTGLRQRMPGLTVQQVHRHPHDYGLLWETLPGSVVSGGSPDAR